MRMSCDIHVTMWSDDQYHSKAFKLWGRNSTKRTNCKRLDSDENGVPWTAFLWSRYLTCTEWTELYGGKKAAGKLVYAHTHFTPSQPPLQRLDFQKEERKERSKSYHSTVAGRDSSNFCILNFQTTSTCPLCMHACILQLVSAAIWTSCMHTRGSCIWPPQYCAIFEEVWP